MHHFFSGFIGLSSGDQLRLNTRVYRHAGNHVRGAGRCVGTVWMCNPGTAAPVSPQSGWGPLKPDPTLEVVLEVLLAADRIAAGVSRGLRADDYIEILNLHYVCDSVPVQGWASYLGSAQNHLEWPDPNSKFCWIAWGAEAPQGAILQACALGIMNMRCFAYDAASKQVARAFGFSSAVHPLAARLQAANYGNYISGLAAEMALSF